jgi:phosphoglycerate dehydrogenase-like enzyme
VTTSTTDTATDSTGSGLSVVVGARLPEALLAQIRDAVGPDATVRVGAGEAELLPLVAEAEVLVAGPLTPRLLAAAPRLRWVHSTGAGVEGLMFPELVASDIVLTNARGAHHVAMPEYVLMAMLAWTHHLPALLKAQARREWVKPVPEEVYGKTLGLLGYGEIGRAVARRAAVLDVRCLAYRRHAGQPGAAGGVAGAAGEGSGAGDAAHGEPAAEPVERTYGPGDLHDFLGACDFVVNSLPLTPKTRTALAGRCATWWTSGWGTDEW